MKKRLSLVLVFSLAVTFFTTGQSMVPIGAKSNKRLTYRSDHMKYERWEGGLSIGVANSMTDIGPSEPNTQPAITDFYSRAFSPALMAHARYRFNSAFSLKSNLGVSMLRGNDRWSENIDVVNRGKSFSNNVYEGSLLAEVYMPKPKRRVKADFGKGSFDLFLFAGLSAFYNTPDIQGPIIDDFDEGIMNADFLYNNLQIGIPFGAGVQWTVSNKWVFGLDMNFRYTFFDYLDGLTRPYSTRNDFYFSTNFNIGYILFSNSNRMTSRRTSHVFTSKPK